MDFAPIAYAILTLALTLTALRLRKIAITKTSAQPRVHRSTYQK